MPKKLKEIAAEPTENQLAVSGGSRAKASGTWDKLEQVFEDRVARALNRLNVPSRKDIDTLS